MATDRGRILVVDDNKINRMLLTRALAEQGHTASTAENGQQALAMLRAEPFDVVLLDILMPELDGYETLAQIKHDNALRHIPVIMISAVDELDSVLRCIEMGATDYLPKPFNAGLLQARINSSLAGKRLRDLELEYLEQVGYVADAAAAVEASQFQTESLDNVAARSDALGRLARVFQRMAGEVYAREQRLKLQLQQLRLDMEEHQRAAGETVSVYIPMDRRHALASGQLLPNRAHGATLFADISGFTPLTESLAQELGLQRGVEELTRQLNQVFGALVEEVHRYGGSVISFSGDAIACWFNADDGLCATACALAMQTAMRQFETIQTPAGTSISVVIKVAVVAGPVRRFLVGDPQIRQMEVLAGQLLNDLALGEHQAKRGEVLVDESITTRTGDKMDVAEWRKDEATGKRFAVVTGLPPGVTAAPWPALPPDSISDSQARPWLLAAVYEKVRGGKSEFLSELRPAVALLLKYDDLDYDNDDEAGDKLDAFVRWAQSVVARYDGAFLQLTMGDKGSYLYVSFGAPVAHYDDAVRAVNAAQELLSPPPELGFIHGIQIGLAQGQMRAGAYGGVAHRTYGVLGDKTNLAARLMMAATDGILCDEAVYRAAQGQVEFVALPPIIVKGKTQPVPVYRPVGEKKRVESAIDRLSPAQQLTLKVASVIGRLVKLDLLRDIYPVEADKPQLAEHLQALEGHNLLARLLSGDALELAYQFHDEAAQEVAYNLMLFAQRRQLHRAIAEWHEQTYAADLSPHYPLLAHHWAKAEDVAKAVHYLEKAGEQARQQGAYQEALAYFNESLTLDKQASVMGNSLDHPADPAQAAT
ncbi:MAG: response regulator [Chloroflexi bacterium]|nr:response regulator [Chloroflexota bacterium]